MDLTATHARALATMQRSDAPAVTFSLESPGTHVPTTGRYTAPSTTTVAGYAVRTKGDPEGYEQGESVRETPLKLFFVPSTLGQEPPQGSVVWWSQEQYRVTEVSPVSPTGSAVATYVTLAK